MVFPLRPEKSMFLYKICIFPTLNDVSAMHWPALKKNHFSSFFFVQASVPTLVASAVPGTKFAPVSPTAGLYREEGSGVGLGRGLFR